MINKFRHTLVVSALVAFGSSAHAETWDGGGADNEFSTPENWNNDVMPTNLTADINGNYTVERSVDIIVQRTFVQGGATLNVTGGTHNDNLSGANRWNTIGSGSVGTINQSGGSYSIGHGLRIGGNNASADGSYILTGGDLAVYRGSNSAIEPTNPGGRPSLEVGGTAGSGLIEISGGSMETRAGVHVGATGTFSVQGSGAASIGIGSNQSGDGLWIQKAGGTLKAGIDLGGLTKIFIDDVDVATNQFVLFESGSVLDIGYYDGGFGGGTWTVMEIENGTITDNGLALAPGVDTGIWSFAVDNSGANGRLTVTAQGDPAGIGGDSFKVEAEAYTSQSGTQLETCQDEGGGQNVSYISNGDWCMYENIRLGTNAILNFRVARPSGTDDGAIAVFLVDGTKIAEVDVPVTGGWQTWETISTTLPAIEGAHDIYLAFAETGTTNGASMFNLNWWSREIGPTRVEAEHFTAGAGYRFEPTQDIGGGTNLGWIAAGEWMEYTIDVAEAGLHKIDFRVASPGGADGIAIVSGGSTVGTLSVSDTSGYQAWETQSVYVEFTSTGTQTLRLEFLSGNFNLNWFSYETAPEPIAITVGNTLKQQMRYGIDYERLWSWSGAASVRDRYAEWSVDDCDVDYVRVAINAKYELNEGTYQEDAYFDNDDSEGGGTNNDRIIPMMQDMKDANPDIKFFASPRPLNEAHQSIPVDKDDIKWQPYPIWITGAPSYTSGSFNFDEVKCSQYLIRYLLMMKYYGFKITYMDLTNEWNYVTPKDVRDISNLFDLYLDPTTNTSPHSAVLGPWEHPEYPDVTLTADDFPQLVAPSAWSYTQGRSWMSGVIYNSYREALDIASCHNTDKGGTAQDFADRVKEKYDGFSQPVPEIWNTEVHGWKSTSNADEVLTFAYMMECINAGFSGLNGWLAKGDSNQGHCYIVDNQRSVKYYIFKKLTTTSNRGFALDVNEPDEFKVYWDPDPDQADADSAVSALIRGNLMTVWVLNHSDTDYPVTINPTGRTISDEPIKFTRWSQFDGVAVEGVTGSLSKMNDTSVYATVQDNSAYCFEILLEPETVPYVRVEAESYDGSNPGSHSTETCSDIGGGLNLSNINDGNWTRYDDIDLDHAESIRLRVAAPSGQADGKIEIRTGSSTGTLIGKAAVPVTGGWQNWCTIETPLDATAGTHDLYLKYVEADSNETASGIMFNLNWFELTQTETPSSITEAPVSGTQVTLTWNAVPGAVGYTVKRSTTKGGSYSIVDDTVTETTYTDTGLTAGVTYYYVIVARYGNGEESAESGEVVAVPSDPIVVEDLNFERPSMNPAGDNVDIELLNSVPGHIYQGQERKDLTTGDWMDVGTPKPGNGEVIIFDFPVGPTDAECFYRITIERQ